MIYPIVAYGDPILKKEAQDIEKGSLDIKQLVADMYETMYNANGVGLAAPQIGKNLRLFVVDGENIDESLKGFKKVFINPTILEEEGEEWPYEEGCLSIPSVREEIYRNKIVKVHYYDIDWNEHTETYEGIAGRIIQHEYDHIEGVLFIDYLSPLKKRLLKSKLINISKGNVKVDYKMNFPSAKGR